MSQQLGLFEEPEVPATSGWMLNEGQQKVLTRLLAFYLPSDPFRKILLAGFAGTGKTFTLNRFIEALRRIHPGVNVGMTAPTHKAVRQLKRHSELQDQLDFGTIHSFLALKQNIDFKTGKVTYKPAENSFYGKKVDNLDILIVDESSMLDDDLYQHIEDCLQSRKRLKVIFTGDSLQIPPVGKKQRTGVAHAIPFDAAQRSSRKIDFLELTEIVRQGKDNPIIAYSADIRKQITSSRIVHEFSHVDGKGVEQIAKDKDVIAKLFKQYFCTEQFKQDPDYVKVIAWRNDTVDKANHKIRLLINNAETLPAIIPGDQLVLDEPFFRGKEMVYSNNEEIEVLQASESGYALPYWMPVNAFDAIQSSDVEDGLKKHIEIVKTYLCLVQAPDAPIEQVLIMHESSFEFFSKLRTKFKEAALKALDSKQKAILWRQYYSIGAPFVWAKYNYCLTAHKSQGSTYDYCISMEWDIEVNHDYEERNRIRYVAATRARNKLFVVR